MLPWSPLTSSVWSELSPRHSYPPAACPSTRHPWCSSPLPGHITVGEMNQRFGFSATPMTGSVRKPRSPVSNGSGGIVAMLPLLALLAGAVALGSSPILVRLSELEPTATAFYRVALAAPAFLLFAFTWDNLQPLSRNSAAGWIELLWLIAAGAFFALDLLCLHWSLRYTSVVNATLFLNFAPIFVSLGAWVAFREPPRPRTVLSYIIAIGGVALLVGSVSSFARGKLFGDGLGLAAGAAYGAYLLVVGRYRDRTPTSVVMGVTTLSCACVLLPATLAMGESL